MPHSLTIEALVLRTYDVGEADRYCILLTREKGRVAARATGVRKMKSRMGGSLLQFQRVTMELKESSAGWIAAGAHTLEDQPVGSLEGFIAASQGIELLLALTQEDEPIPEIFDATVTFVHACGKAMPHAVLSFHFRLLHLLGLLPATEDLIAGFHLSPIEQLFLRASVHGHTPPAIEDTRALERISQMYVKDHLQKPLKSVMMEGEFSK